MSPLSGPLLSPMADAAARTAAAGTARLLAAWCVGSPLPEAADRRCEGVADLAARRARVSQSLFFTDGATAGLPVTVTTIRARAITPGTVRWSTTAPMPMSG